MAVVFDAEVDGGVVTSSSTLQYSHPVNASATAFLVEVGVVSSVGASMTSVTVGTKPLALLGRSPTFSILGTITAWTELWGVIGPPTGTPQVQVVSPANTEATVASTSYIGATSFGNLVGNVGTTATLTSGAIVSRTGDRVVSAHTVFNRTLSTPSGTLRSNQFESNAAATMLIQESAGAATVTLTSVATGTGSWAVASVNLVAGNILSIGSTLSLTTSMLQSASFVGLVWTVGASLALTTTSSVVGVGQPYGPPLRYVGRPPDTDSVVVPASYAAADNASTLVTPSWLTQQITSASQFLVTSSWINSQINGTGTNPTYLSQSAVTTALGSYIPTSALGASNGVAQLNGSGQIPAGQLPTLITNNLAFAYDCVHDGTVFLQTGTSFTVVTQNVGEFVAANIVVPGPEDGGPDFPWVPLPFAYVVGYSGGGTPSGTRLSGTGNFGAMFVTISGEQSPIYGMGICNDTGSRPGGGSAIPDYHLLVPGCLSTGHVTPLTQPPIIGGATLDLSFCNWTEADYIFEGTGSAGILFFVICVPGLI